MELEPRWPPYAAAGLLAPGMVYGNASSFGWQFGENIIEMVTQYCAIHFWAINGFGRVMFS